jgi:hypothetical protein
MNSNRLAFGVVAVACVAAAGVGGYVATRQNPPVEARQAAAPEAAQAPAALETTSSAVQAAPAGPAAPARPAAAEPVKMASPVARSEPAPAPVTPSRPKPAAETRRPSAPVQARRPEPSEPVPAVEPIVTDPPLVAEVPTLAPPELPEPLAPPAREFVELVVPRESVIGLQNETPLSSEAARVEDRVEAHVTRDVRVNGQVAIPSGTRALGEVTEVERGGKFKERARLSVRFHTLVLADGTRLPISTETISREGDAPNGTAKVGGGAVAGAILGAIIGGAKGAAVGAGAGAGAGTAVAAAGDGSTAEFPAGTPVTVKILAPVTITVEQ